MRPIVSSMKGLFCRLFLSVWISLVAGRLEQSSLRFSSSILIIKGKTGRTTRFLESSVSYVSTIPT